ncbi:MAG: pitrilysin family protein [Candidatus Nanopelagicales bacterium]
MARSSAGGLLPAREQTPGTTRTLLKGTDGGIVRRTVLPGGLRVVTEQIPGVRSAAFGIWVGVGSRDETPAQTGSAHYLEHLLFKGTQRRTAMDISASLEAVGGEMNAFTTKEYTCFYARVLGEDLPLAVDVVSDMVTDSLILPSDVESERGVILEEIAMHDDDPTDLVHDEFTQVLFGDTPLGRSILGTEDSIRGIGRGAIDRFYRRRYRPESVVVSAAGRVEHTAVVREVRAAFGTVGWLDGDGVPDLPRRGRVRRPSAGGTVRVVSRPTEQANVVLGVPGIVRTDERRYVLGVLNSALGGGMSSRLFQEVREKRGLAYSVYSFATQYADAGVVGVYAGCQPQKVDEVLSLCREELVKLVDHGITDDELRRGKGQLRGSLVLGQEDTGARMSRIAKAELMYDELPSVDEVLRRIDAVTPEEVRILAAELLDRPPALAVIGPFDPDRDFAASVA